VTRVAPQLTDDELVIELRTEGHTPAESLDLISEALARVLERGPLPFPMTALANVAADAATTKESNE
jgi:hypothetical protein